MGPVMRCRPDGMDIEDDIYDNITEFSHEEIERVTSLSKSLIEENAALHIQLNKATAQIALLEKSKQVLKRNFACLLETAKAEIDRKDGRIKELQSIVDQRVLRNSHVSSQQIDDIVERRVRQIKRRVRRDGRRLSKTDTTSQGRSGDFGDLATQPHSVLAVFDKENVSFRFYNSSFSVVCRGEISKPRRSRYIKLTQPSHTTSHQRAAVTAPASTAVATRVSTQAPNLDENLSPTECETLSNAVSRPSDKELTTGEVALSDQSIVRTAVRRLAGVDRKSGCSRDTNETSTPKDATEVGELNNIGDVSLSLAADKSTGFVTKCGVGDVDKPGPVDCSNGVSRVPALDSASRDDVEKNMAMLFCSDNCSDLSTEHPSSQLYYADNSSLVSSPQATNPTSALSPNILTAVQSSFERPIESVLPDTSNERAVSSCDQRQVAQEDVAAATVNASETSCVIEDRNLPAMSETSSPFNKNKKSLSINQRIRSSSIDSQCVKAVSSSDRECTTYPQGNRQSSDPAESTTNTGPSSDGTHIWSPSEASAAREESDSNCKQRDDVGKENRDPVSVCLPEKSVKYVYGSSADKTSTRVDTPFDLRQHDEISLSPVSDFSEDNSSSKGNERVVGNDFFPSSSSISSRENDGTVLESTGSTVHVPNAAIEDACDSFPVAVVHKGTFIDGEKNCDSKFNKTSRTASCGKSSKSNIIDDLCVSDDTASQIQARVVFPPLKSFSSDSPASPECSTIAVGEKNSLCSGTPKKAANFCGVIAASKVGSLRSFPTESLDKRKPSASETPVSDVELDVCLEELDYTALDLDADSLRNAGVSPRKLGVRPVASERSPRSNSPQSKKTKRRNMMGSAPESPKLKNVRLLDRAGVESRFFNSSDCVRKHSLSGIKDLPSKMHYNSFLSDDKIGDDCSQLEDGEISEASSSQSCSKDAKSVRRIVPVCLSRKIQRRKCSSLPFSSLSPSKFHGDRIKRKYEHQNATLSRTQNSLKERSPPCHRYMSQKNRNSPRKHSLSSRRSKSSGESNRYRECDSPPKHCRKAKIRDCEHRRIRDSPPSPPKRTVPKYDDHELCRSSKSGRHSNSENTIKPLMGRIDYHSSRSSTHGSNPSLDPTSDLNYLRRSPRKHSSSTSRGPLPRGDAPRKDLSSKRQLVGAPDRDNADKNKSRKLSESIIRTGNSEVNVEQQAIDERPTKASNFDLPEQYHLNDRNVSRCSSISPDKRKRLSSTALAAKHHSIMLRRRSRPSDEDFMNRQDLFDPEASCSSAGTTPSLVGSDVGSPSSAADSWACDGAKLKRYMQSFINNTPYHEDTLLSNAHSSSDNASSTQQTVCQPQTTEMAENRMPPVTENETTFVWPSLVAVDVPPRQMSLSRMFGVSAGADKDVKISSKADNGNLSAATHPIKDTCNPAGRKTAGAITAEDVCAVSKTVLNNTPSKCLSSIENDPPSNNVQRCAQQHILSKDGRSDGSASVRSPVRYGNSVDAQEKGNFGGDENSNGTHSDRFSPLSPEHQALSTRTLPSPASSSKPVLTPSSGCSIGEVSAGGSSECLLQTPSATAETTIGDRVSCVIVGSEQKGLSVQVNCSVRRRRLPGRFSCTSMPGVSVVSTPVSKRSSS